MIKKTCPTREAANMRGGNGTVSFTDFSTLEETYGHIRIFSRVVLEPGCSIGYHTHDTDTEFYCILSGTATVSDNGVEVVMGPGEVMVTGDGAGHSMENRSDEPLEFIALVVNR